MSVVDGEFESTRRPERFGARLAQRLRPDAQPSSEDDAAATVLPGRSVSLAPASQVEIEGDEVRFWVGFAGELPNEHWLRVFCDGLSSWPPHLRSPRVEEGRGVWFGPLAVVELEEHVTVLKQQIAAANDTYARVVEPDLRRRELEARRREDERVRVRADVEDRLKNLLG